MKICKIEECGREVYAKHLCTKHYNYNRLHGTPVPPEKEKECSVEDCNLDAFCKGFCRGHYNKQWLESRIGKGAVDENYRGKEARATYQSAHYRVRMAKGRAAEYPCVDDCGEQAEEWSLNEDSEELLIQATGRDAGMKFSMNIDDYEPRCRSCHKKYDSKHRLLKDDAYKRNDPTGPRGVGYNDGPCSFDGCERNAVSRRLCYSHYRQYRAGDELRPLRLYRKSDAA